MEDKDQCLHVKIAAFPNEDSNQIDMDPQVEFEENRPTCEESMLKVQIGKHNNQGTNMLI